MLSPSDWLSSIAVIIRTSLFSQTLCPASKPRVGLTLSRLNKFFSVAQEAGFLVLVGCRERTSEVRRPETDVLPLCHATNRYIAVSEQQKYVKCSSHLCSGSQVL